MLEVDVGLGVVVVVFELEKSLRRDEVVLLIEEASELGVLVLEVKGIVIISGFNVLTMVIEGMPD